MATISHMSISTPSLQLPRSSINSCGIQCRMVFALGPRPWDFNWRGEGNFGVLTNKILFRFVFAYFASPPSMHYWRRPSFVKISAASAKALDYTDGDSELVVVISDNHEMGVSRTDYLLQVLHQSARRFCDAIKCHELSGNGPQLAKAWIGVDVHAWHKHIAYQVAVYALLQTAKEMEIMLCGRHGNDTAPVCKILSPKVSILHNDIVTQLKMKDTKLVEWFKMELLPVLAGDFSTLLERWAVEYTESGVAANILATSCCIAAKKLGIGRISSPSFTSSLPDAIGELMDALCGLVSMDKLHSLASVAGFEQEFLAHFGSKTLLNNTNPEVVFWLGLVQRKLVAAFQREGVVASLQNKVVTEEIGWLDFYNAVPGISHQERKRSKQHAIQAEKEIILPAVFNVCSNVFSSFGHFSKSTQQSLDANLVAFLLRSQNLLNICLEDYWAAYDQSCKLLKVTEISLPELSSGNQDTVNVTISFEEVHEKVDELTMRWVTEYMPECMSRMRKNTSSDRMDAFILEKIPPAAETIPVHQSLLRKSGNKLMSTISDLWMGTRLLFIDISTALGLIQKKIHRCALTMRERKKLRRTLADIVSVIPVAILMLLPLSAVGHAAILAAIKKYIPFLIPSPYSTERLDIVKQLKRTKKMEVQSWCNLDVSSSILYE